MLVNVASKCGYTPQYAGLESLYKKYQDRGLVIVGIPANNFASQEPGTNAEIKTFCHNKYDVTFPMMAKVSVLGEDKAPLYAFLTDKSVNPQIGGDIKWNFTKFLFDRNGKPVERFQPAVTPDSPQVTAAIEAALGPPPSPSPPSLTISYNEAGRNFSPDFASGTRRALEWRAAALAVEQPDIAPSPSHFFADVPHFRGGSAFALDGHIDDRPKVRQ